MLLAVALKMPRVTVAGDAKGQPIATAKQRVEICEAPEGNAVGYDNEYSGKYIDGIIVQVT